MNDIVPIDTVERFAALCAELDDCNVGRAQVLANAGFDERALGELRQRWLPLLAAGKDPDLAIRFSAAYARVRQDLAQAPSPHEDAFGDAGADTERDVPSCAADSDHTAEMALHHSASVWPFQAGSVDQTNSNGQRHEPSRPLMDPVETTLEVPCASIIAAVLPFSSPRATGRRQHLQRFDTQTGQPLPAPIWVDEPRRV